MTNHKQRVYYAHLIILSAKSVVYVRRRGLAVYNCISFFFFKFSVYGFFTAVQMTRRHTLLERFYGTARLTFDLRCTSVKKIISESFNNNKFFFFILQMVQAIQVLRFHLLELEKVSAH